MEKIIFPQCSKSETSKKMSFELPNHHLVLRFTFSQHPTHPNASQRDLSIRVGEVANLHAFGGFRLLEMDGNWGFATPTNFQDAATHFNFHGKFQVSKNSLPRIVYLGDSSFVVRIHITVAKRRSKPLIFSFGSCQSSGPSSMRLQGCLHSLEPLTDLVFVESKWYLFSKLLAVWLLNLSC